MSQSKLTCGNEIRSVLKILITVDLVLSILESLTYLLIGIGIVAIFSSKETKDILAVELDTEGEVLVKAFGWCLIVFALLLLSLNIFLFNLISTGIKKRNYTKCFIWFVIYVALQIFNVIVGAYWIITEKNIIIGLVFWILPVAFQFYLLGVTYLYLKDLKREVFGGAQNGPPENNQVV